MSSPKKPVAETDRRFDGLDLAMEAARSVVEDWPTQAPVIDGLVGQTLVPEYTDIIKIHERGQDVEWRVSKGCFVDGDGHHLHIATRLPDPKMKRADDLAYIVTGVNLIIGKNVKHITASIESGFVINNDDELTAKLPTNPLGFTALFRKIYEESKRTGEEQLANQKADKKRAREKRGKNFRRVIAILGFSAVGVFGVPPAVDKITEYLKDKAEKEQQAQLQDEQARAQAELQAEQERQSAVDAFDAEFPAIEHGAVVETDIMVMVPATREFTTISEIPGLDVSSSPQDIAKVRSLPAPDVGGSVSYSIPVPEGASFTIAHTGDANLLVTAYIDSATQMLIVTSIEIDQSDEVVSVANVGEIVIILNK
ncbi:hypothetical protein KC878_00555 [Candidatus Saccharibacteria bacterium]|nr:hypothetical protein [Candidatus Saccharibacteria bacterium]MCB9821461.1 hypothetical protein [Candidatus Nomurabacteria bacterium]